MLKAGDVLGEDVRLDELIGEGATGWVFRGQQVQLGRTVAVKVLKVEDVAEPVASWKRFQREARLLADLVHPGIVQVYTVGHHERWPYLVMEYLRGRTIHARAKAEGRLSVAAALHVVESVCEPLELAHQRGIVHRDLKPANLFETDDGTIKVIDFGIARMFRGDDEHRGRFTETGSIVGTPAFVAPEQARDQPVDARTDIYALGVILYQLLSGRLPYDETDYSSDLALLGRIAAGIDLPVPLQEHRADVPDAVSALVAQCMRYKPEHRFQSARSLREAIAAILVELRPTAKASDKTISAPSTAPLSGPRREPGAPSARMLTLEAAANVIGPTAPAALTLAGKRASAVSASASADLKTTAPETPRSMGRAGAPRAEDAPAAKAPPAVAISRQPHPHAASARRSRRPMLAAAWLVAAVAIAGGFTLVRARLEQQHKTVPTPPPPSTTKRPAVAAPAPRQPTIAAAPTAKRMGRVRVVTTPPGARVIVGGAVVGQAPVDVDGAADEVQRVRLELDGFAPRDEDVLPTLDGGEAQFTLRRLTATRHHRQAKPKSSTAPTETQAAPRDRDGIANPFEE